MLIRKIILVHLFLVSGILASDIAKSRETAITRAIEKVGPAVASINVEQHVSSFSFDPFFGFGFPRDIITMKSSGSGVMISPDGYVLLALGFLIAT